MLRFSLAMSFSQPGGLESQELITSLKKELGSRGILLQWSSEQPCPAGRSCHSSTEKAGVCQRERQIPPGSRYFHWDGAQEQEVPWEHLWEQQQEHGHGLTENCLPQDGSGQMHKVPEKVLLSF